MVQSSLVQLDAASAEPLYRQLFDAIAGRIERGAFAPGHRLPPTRALAVELGTHRNTVVRAYRALEDAGFVESTVGRGTFVRDVPARGAGSEEAPPEGGGIAWGSLFSEASGAEALGRRARLKRRPDPPGAINLGGMEPAPELLASDQLRRCMDHVLRTRGGRALGYAPRGGLPRLRELLVEDLARQGVSARAEDVLVTSGSQQALDLLVRALVDPGDPVLVNASTYLGALNTLQVGGARPVPVPSDAEGPQPAALSRLVHSGAKAFYLMPNAHNPTGRCISARRRAALVAWSRRSGVPLIEDDYVSDLHFDEPPPPPLRSLDGDVIYIGTYSKKLIPALRIGYVVAPPPLHRRLEALKSATDLGSSALMQHVLAEFLERGYLRAHLARILPEYRARRAALSCGLRETLPEGLSVRAAQVGPILWVDLPAHVDTGLLHDRCVQAGVLLMPSLVNRVGEGADHGVRLCFCGEDEARLREGGRRVGRVIAQLLSELGPAAGAPTAELM